MTRRRPYRWLVIAAVLGGLCAFACSPDSDPAPTGERSITRVPEPEDVLDEDLMLALAQAKNFHHKAKVYMSDANLPEAVAQMEAVLAIRFPPGAPEGDDVRLDARALLAKLLVLQGKVDEAMTVVDQGIGGARRDSFFLANLYTVKGEVHRARAALLDGQGDAVKPRIKDEKRQAIEAFDHSIRIENALIKQRDEDRKRRQKDGE